MTLSSPSHLLAFLESTGLAPKKSLSQNFLIDRNILHKIALQAKIEKNDLVLEIGPGPGALTEVLLEKGAEVVAVEKDRKFAEQLTRLGNVEVHSLDIRDFSFDRMKSGRGAKVVANLPYHLTSVILSLLLPRMDLFSSLTLMVQEEVGRRMTAKRGESAYSSLSLFLSFYSEPHYAFKVSNRCFYPVPKVQSAVVHLIRRESLPDIDPAYFFPLVRKAFQQRRKMIRSSLASVFPKEKIEHQLEAVGCRKDARPEMLSLEEWVLLLQQL